MYKTYQASYAALWRLGAMLLLLAACEECAVAQVQRLPQAELSEKILSRLEKYHAEAAHEKRPVRVAYFHPSDIAPLEGYQERISRIMLDVQNFYQAEMKERGFGERVFPLELADGKLKLHVVKGKDPAEQYSRQSGDKVEAELRAALAGTVDFRRDVVLVFNGMCKQLDSGKRLFYAPYYGRGGAGNGFCHVADCEVMDTLHYENTKEKIHYTEANGTRNQSLGQFSSLYIGGVAHELGHALSLPHNRQKPWEKQRQGTALMGSGNYTFRDDLRGGDGSFLTFATCIRLAGHPLFTDSRHGLEVAIDSELEDVKFSTRGTTLLIEGKLKTNVEAYAVIAYTNPAIEKGWQNNDYDALTWVSDVDDGRFGIAAKIHEPGQSGLKLTFCHLNGKKTSFRYEYGVNDKGEPNATDLDGQHQLRRIETIYLAGRHAEAAQLAAQAVPDFKETAFEPKLRLVTELVKKREFGEPGEVAGDAAYLSDLKWESAAVGWGQPARDQYDSPDHEYSIFLQLGDKFYPHGLYAHAPSSYVYKLDKRWTKFLATAGLQKDVGSIGTAIFIVKCDGEVKFRSDFIRGGEKAVDVDVDVRGVDELELIVESGKQGNARCWSIWADARLTRPTE